MKLFRKAVKGYAKFIANKPWIMIMIVLFLTLSSVYFSSKIEMKSTDYQDMLPDNLPVMQAFKELEDSFGGSESAMISVEIDPQYFSSNEPRDIREPEIIRYIDLISSSVLVVDDVESVDSIATILRDLNGGVLPKSKNEIIKLISDNDYMFDSYLADDMTLSVISFRLSDSYEASELVINLNEVIERTDAPHGIIVNPAGDVVADPVMEETIQPDMARTSNIAMFGILIVLLVMFGSIIYGLTPLATIIFGVLWAMGFVGLIGMNMSPQTSGVISMIMGIGIDFGIQIVSRFRAELRKNPPAVAMEKTMSEVFAPMFTTTLAALIGFKAMSMGNLTMMAEMGTMMSYGVGACFVAAITVVPAILIIASRITEKFNFKKMKKMFMNAVIIFIQ